MPWGYAETGISHVSEPDYAVSKDRQFYTYEDAVQMRQRNEEIKEPFSYVIWGTEGIHLLEIRIWDGPAGWKCMP